MRALHLAVVVTLTSVGCSGDDNPASPTPTVSSVTVAPATPGQTIFIGQTVQFEATSTLSDGRMQTDAGTWGSDNTAVATVDQNGVVTAVAAGEATIFVDVNPRGTLLIRVFPEFDGTWNGNAAVTGCQESGAFIGLFCVPGSFAVGTVFAFPGMFTQTDAMVDAVLDYSANLDMTKTITTSGSVSVGGELQLMDAALMPPVDPLVTQQQNWRSRADTPGTMTGTFDIRFTAPGLAGEATVNIRLQSLTRTGSGTLSSAGAARGFGQTLGELSRTLRNLR